MLALSVRFAELTREAYESAVDSGELTVAHSLRGAIHAVAPEDAAIYGRGLIAADDDGLGRQVQRLAEEKGFDPTDAVAEVEQAARQSLGGGQALDKNALHDRLRDRVNPDLMPWCKGCNSYHVAPMLWRYATVAAGVRLDSERRYALGEPTDIDDDAEVVRRFLRFYGPATTAELAQWTGVGKRHANRLWEVVADELTGVTVGEGEAWLLAADLGELESPKQVEDIRLIPPGDPYLQKPNRPLLAPDADLRKCLFRPVGSPGVVLREGRLAGLWRVKRVGKKEEICVEKLTRFALGDLEQEAQRVADLRGGQLDLVLA